MGTGELYAVVEWIPAAMGVQFAHWTFLLVRRLLYCAVLGLYTYTVEKGLFLLNFFRLRIPTVLAYPVERLYFSTRSFSRKT